MKCSLGISNFVEEISSLSHSVVFLYFFDSWKSFTPGKCVIIWSIMYYLVQIKYFACLLLWEAYLFHNIYVKETFICWHQGISWKGQKKSLLKQSLTVFVSWSTSPPCCTYPRAIALCNVMDCSPPGSSIHGISQARILQWVTVSCSRGSSWPRDWTHISCFSCIGR